MAAVVTEDEKSRARYHLGYGGVDAASTFALGVPAAMQTTFMIETALNKISQSAVDRFRTLICRLDGLEEQVFCGVDLADVEEIGDIKVNRKRLRELAQYYKIAQQSLANLLMVPANPFDMREWLSMGGVNVGVSG